MGLWPKVSVIIPFGGKSDYIEETLRYLSRVEYPDYEVILLPDKPFSSGDDVKVVPTGPVGPAAKRDMALAYAEGEILAFLDDDAYPDRDWLKNAVKYFQDPEVAAIGGPAVTPPSDGLLQKASGYVYASLLGGGNYAYRYVPQKMREIDDHPTCNLFVRKLVFEQLGGFDTSFWPGEDTKLCLEMTRDLGKKIIYAPDVVAYHHRRPLFGPHLRQVHNYALHRGYFAKRFPETSLKLSYFLPTLLVAGITGGGAIALFFPPLRSFYLAGLLVYLIAVTSSAAVTSRHLLLTPLVAGGIIATHLVYGIWFVVGLLSRRLKEESEPR